MIGNNGTEEIYSINSTELKDGIDVFRQKEDICNDEWYNKILTMVD